MLLGLVRVRRGEMPASGGDDAFWRNILDNVNELMPNERLNSIKRLTSQENV